MSDPLPQGLLATLSFGLPRQSRQLPKEAKKVEEENHAQSGVAKVSVYYFQQQQGKTLIDGLSELKAHFNFWKKQHERLTIPWLGSARFLAGAIVQQYISMRSDMERIAPEKAAEFYGVHQDWENTAPQRMGSLYDRADFPSLDDCRERIRWENLLTPLPEAQQWQRVALINPNYADMEARHAEAVNRARESAKAEVWNDLIGNVQHIVDTLSKDRPRIFETLISNLNSIVDKIPAYSPLFNDPNLDRFANETRSALSLINVDDLRQDPDLRARTVAQARDLLTSFGQLGQRRLV